MGVCLAAVLVGLVVAYIIFKVEKKPWPYSFLFFRKADDYPLVSRRDPDPTQVETAATRNAGQARKDADDDVLRMTKQWKSAMEAKSPEARTTELMREVEANLKIASAGRENNLVSFKLDVFGFTRGSLNSLSPELSEGLSEAYTDMGLANTLVSMAKKGTRSGAEIGSNYAKLCAKITTELEKVLPGLKNSGI